MKWMVATNGHHCTLLLLIGGRSEQSFCCSNRCVECMWIGMEPCTHWCACHCNAHYVSAVNQKTVSIQCNSGRLLIAFWRICCVILCYFFILSYLSLLMVQYFVCMYIILFVSLLFFCMNADICRLINPLRCGHSCIIISHSRNHHFHRPSLSGCVPQIFFCWLFCDSRHILRRSQLHLANFTDFSKILTLLICVSRRWERCSGSKLWIKFRCK